MKSHLIVGALGALLVACASAPGSAMELNGSKWTLASAERGALATPGSGVTLEFSADQLSGYSGCNSYTASYTFANGTLSVGTVSATKRGCADAAGAVEKAWFELLRGGTLTLNQVGNDLSVQGADGSKLRFAPTP